MRRLFAPSFVIAGALFAACSGQQSSVTAPSAVATAVSPSAATAASSGVHTNLTAPAVSDACKPSVNSVVFDPGQLGKVTITNNSSCTNEFLYVVWSVSPTDEGDQTVVAAQGARLSPGERRQLTVGFHEACGTKYQRDVYIGLSDDRVAYSYSDMGNYFFAALGYYQYAPRCDTPPSAPPLNPNNPPVDVCPNIEGNQATVPPGLTLVDGICLPSNNTPTDVCPNLEGNQATVPAGYTLVGGLCLPSNNPPTDVCPNLEGNQATVPAGYTLIGGICVVIPPPPALCTDASAVNFGGLAPCQYLPPAPSCGPFTFSGPISTDVPNGAPGRLAYARSFGPAYANVVEVHPSHGGTFHGNNSHGFTFTPSQNYAVLIFHHTHGGHDAQDIVFTGVTAGVPLSVPTDGGDVFYFNCPE